MYVHQKSNLYEPFEGFFLLSALKCHYSLTCLRKSTITCQTCTPPGAVIVGWECCTIMRRKVGEREKENSLPVEGQAGAAAAISTGAIKGKQTKEEKNVSIFIRIQRPAAIKCAIASCCSCRSTLSPQRAAPAAHAKAPSSELSFNSYTGTN